MEGLVVLKRNKPMTTSLIVAEKFGKRHDNVLQKIKKLDCSEKFSLLNFKESTYVFARDEVTAFAKLVGPKPLELLT